MSFYSSPFISRVIALDAMQSATRKDFDFLYSCLQICPEHTLTITKLINVIYSAAQVYLARATGASDATVENLVRHFLSETSTFNATSPGGHILIWPFFIVGAECTSERDREFILTQLRSLWGFTGFGNILYAIEILKEMWRQGPAHNWTHFLVERVEGFIM